MFINPQERIILTLDTSDYNIALEVVKTFREHINIFRVGLDLFISSGLNIVEAINKLDKKIFLDIKLNDIPNTITNAIINAAKAGTYMISVHSTIGAENIKNSLGKVSEFCLKENLKKPIILGVTVLSSLSQKNLNEELGVNHSFSSYVKFLAINSQKAGFDGIMIPAFEIAKVRKVCREDFLLAALIRPSWVPPDFYKTTIKPQEAVRAGADLLILGRKFLQHNDLASMIELLKLEILAS
ncbi:MAG: orotidine-5'-phosphate decarboxylase [Thermodesulfovibrionales bacterium]|nr:orotidine-5'-phosphate decarboxylase [Thermodesulfovibrionales bacterium]